MKKTNVYSTLYIIVDITVSFSEIEINRFRQFEHCRFRNQQKTTRAMPFLLCTTQTPSFQKTTGTT